jgi:hypothetical protein
MAYACELARRAPTTGHVSGPLVKIMKCIRKVFDAIHGFVVLTNASYLTPGGVTCALNRNRILIAHCHGLLDWLTAEA